MADIAKDHDTTGSSLAPTPGLATQTPDGGRQPAATSLDTGDTAEQTHAHHLCIVVGVDGSACSQAALRWAMVQARSTNATIEAVNVWHEPVMLGYTSRVEIAAFQEGVSISVVAETILAETVAAAAAQAGHAGVVRSRVVRGHAAQVLLQAATGAQMLVVGSRGHGAFAGILLGSVSQHCVQHAPCPVVVVPR